MKADLFKVTQAMVLIGGVILFFAGCSKNTIILDLGEENGPSGSEGSNPDGTSLITFNASIEDRNLLTRAMSPMNQGIKSTLYAFEPSAQSGTKQTPSAQGLYITSSPGVLTGVNGYKMYLENGVFDFYAVSDNFSTIPPKFLSGKSEPLFNGIDYLWWHSPNLDVASTQVNIPIVYLHAATQVVIEVTEGDGIKLNKLVSAMITPSYPGASMDLATGAISPATTLDSPDKMGINGSLAQYIMLPLKISIPLSLTMDVMVNGENALRTYAVDVPVPEGELKGGNSYLFNAIIDGNTVTFSSANVKNWTEVDETGNPLYPTLK